MEVLRGLLVGTRTVTDPESMIHSKHGPSDPRAETFVCAANVEMHAAAARASICSGRSTQKTSIPERILSRIACLASQQSRVKAGWVGSVGRRR